MKKTLKYVFAVLAVTGLVANAELINLANPSLESGLVPPAGNNGVPESGWFTFGSALAGVPVGGYFGPISNNDGPNAAYAENGASISQTVQLDAGTTYRLTAGVGTSPWLAKNDGNYALAFLNSSLLTVVETTGVVAANTGSFADDFVVFTPANTGIFSVSLGNRGSVPGTGAGNNESTIFFDNVRLEVVPEPGTLGLVAVFGGAVLFIRRRLKN